ncbi:MAG: hypothetical protein Q8N88_04780 [Nanoarchaeota archaeon]|nr:hypothetical protein [Nanoarchaeota archaeon]
MGLGFTNGTIGCYPAGHPLNCTFNITGCWTALFGPDECVVIRMRECRNVSGELLVVDIARTEWVGLGAVPEGCLVEDIESVTDASCNFLKLPFFSGFSLVLTIIILIIFYIVFVKKNKSKGKKK